MPPATPIILLRNGEVVATRPPATVMTAEFIRFVFGVEADILTDPRTAAPLCLPFAITSQ